MCKKLLAVYIDFSKLFKYMFCLFFQAENPPYWSVTEWCEGFMQLLDYMDIKQVHLFGASLGN